MWFRGSPSELARAGELDRYTAQNARRKRRRYEPGRSANKTQPSHPGTAGCRCRTSSTALSRCIRFRKLVGYIRGMRSVLCRVMTSSFSFAEEASRLSPPFIGFMHPTLRPRTTNFALQEPGLLSRSRRSPGDCANSKSRIWMAIAFTFTVIDEALFGSAA